MLISLNAHLSFFHFEWFNCDIETVQVCYDIDLGTCSTKQVAVFWKSFIIHNKLGCYSIVWTKSANYEVDELGAILVTLSAEEGTEDDDNDVIDDVLSILDDGVSQQENDSDVLAAVAEQEEGNAWGFNNVSESWLNLLVETAGISGSLDLLDQVDEFSLGSNVILILRLSSSVPA